MQDEIACQNFRGRRDDGGNGDQVRRRNLRQSQIRERELKRCELIAQPVLRPRAAATAMTAAAAAAAIATARRCVSHFRTVAANLARVSRLSAWMRAASALQLYKHTSNRPFLPRRHRSLVRSHFVAPRARHAQVARRRRRVKRAIVASTRRFSHTRARVGTRTRFCRRRKHCAT